MSQSKEKEYKINIIYSFFSIIIIIIIIFHSFDYMIFKLVHLKLFVYKLYKNSDYSLY